MAERMSAQSLKNIIEVYKNGTDSEKEEIKTTGENILKDYANGALDLDIEAHKDVVDLIQLFGAKKNEASGEYDYSPVGELALARFRSEHEELEKQTEATEKEQALENEEVIENDNASEQEESLGVEQPEKENDEVSENDKVVEDIEKSIEKAKKLRLRSPYSDQNQYLLDRAAMDVYLDMGLVSAEDHAKSSETETIEIISKIPDLTGEKAVEFSDKLVNKLLDEDLFYKLPPMTLTNAYEATKEKIESGADNKDELQAKLDKIASRMDSLSEDFASNSGLFFADHTNIADVYDGYNKMFEARQKDLDASTDNQKIVQLESNRQKLEEGIQDYDSRWNLTDVSEENADKLEKRWDDLQTSLKEVKVSDDTLKLASNYKFLDKDGNVIPQFINDKGKKSEKYEAGSSLDENGRLARVIDLAKQDVALRNLGKVDEEIKEEELEVEVNEQIPYKLFEIDTAEKIVQGALENPEQFTDPKYLEKFVKDLGDGKGQISDKGYEAAMDVQVNKTAGFAQRIKQKVKDGAKKIGGLFGKIFNPIKDIDKRAKDRVKSPSVDKRKKRIEFFVRLLKGFGSAFLVSAAITTIATAAAATAGISVAASIATIGIVTGIVMTSIQIAKWRNAQIEAGKPADIKAFLKDKRMLATVGSTGLAAVAMMFGASGLSQAAMALGFGSLALGGANNVLATYKDAKNAGFSRKESIAWALANAVAVIAGGVAGRTTAAAAINAFNEANPTNEVFQNKETKIETVTETKTVYTQDAIDNAERITKMWYQDNPAELQNRVDLINQYNAEHGTNINPYRAIMLSADAGGQTFDNMGLHVDGGGVEYSAGKHTVLTERWGQEYGFDRQELDALKNLFDGGKVNADGINAAIKADSLVSDINEVGVVTSGDAPHYDGVLAQNTVDANGNPVFNTYANGDSAFTTETNVFETRTDVYNPVDVPWGLGMFGNRLPRTDAEFEQLKDRAGALLDKLVENRQPEQEPEHEPEIIETPEEEVEVLPAHEEVSALPEHIEEKPMVLKLTRAQAKKLDDLESQIEKLQKKREEKPLKQSEAEKLKAKLTGLKSELNNLKNKLGMPEENGARKATDEELNAAKKEAYRRADLESELDNLKSLEKQKEGFEAHKNNEQKLRGEEIDREIESSTKRIEELGGKESLDDESYLIEPVHIKPNYEKAIKKVEDKRTSKKKDSFKKAKDFLHDYNEEVFDMGQDFNDEMNRQKDVRKKLNEEYEKDKKQQEKLRRKHQQRLIEQQLKANKSHQ